MDYAHQLVQTSLYKLMPVKRRLDKANWLHRQAKELHACASLNPLRPGNDARLETAYNLVTRALRWMPNGHIDHTRRAL